MAFNSRLPLSGIYHKKNNLHTSKFYELIFEEILLKITESCKLHVQQ